MTGHTGEVNLELWVHQRDTIESFWKLKDMKKLKASEQFLVKWEKRHSGINSPAANTEQEGNTATLEANENKSGILS